MEMLTVGDGADARRIAVKHRQAGGGTGPGLVWLGGYRSDMDGTKAVALDALAERLGLACTRFDYSGHGHSGGAFTDGTLSRWLEESLAVIEDYASGPQILVGSSMGGWIALRIAQILRARAEHGDGRLAGMVLIAPAPDFTAELIEPGLTDAQRADLVTKGYFEEATPYGPEPNVYTRALIEDGRRHLVLDGVIETGCPVHILQGMADPDVPHGHALQLMEHLPCDDIVLTLVRDGDHRLSRPQDLAKLVSVVTEMTQGR